MNRIVQSVVSYQSILNKRLLCSNSLICLSDKNRSKGSHPSEKNDTTPYQSVTDYYVGKSVFITGGTGFLGKVLIERLLYNCSDIQNIYILIRGKKDLTIEGRLHRMFSLPLFDKLKSAKPDALNKVIPIGGDLIIPELFIESKDEQTLIDKIAQQVAIKLNQKADSIKQAIRLPGGKEKSGPIKVQLVSESLQTTFITASKTCSNKIKAIDIDSATQSTEMK